jgi:hypothetical protein
VWQPAHAPPYPASSSSSSPAPSSRSQMCNRPPNPIPSVTAIARNHRRASLNQSFRTNAAHVAYPVRSGGYGMRNKGG